MTTQTCYLQSPLGWLALCADAGGLRSITVIDAPPLVTEPPTLQPLREAYKQLAEYFRGERSQFSLQLNPGGTDFQRAVWSELAAIPYGSTVSYKALAERVGKPGGARAVGMANNKNPLPIVVPCHRVVGADGALVGYALGLDVKRRLLAHEGVSA